MTAGIRKATIAQKIFPVVCGSAFKNKGVQNLLDAVVRLSCLLRWIFLRCKALPSTIPTKRWSAEPATSEPFSALVFKIMTDPFVGQLCFVRVYSGKLNSGESVYNVAKGKQ